jgi:cellulase
VIVSDNNNAYTVQIPSDIKSGTYILRAEIIALHGNANRNASSPPSPLAGGQYYIGCVNVDVIGGGNARPAGVAFPGAYSKEENEASIYLPLANHTKEQEAQGHIFNSKYVSWPTSLSRLFR